MVLRALGATVVIAVLAASQAVISDTPGALEPVASSPPLGYELEQSEPRQARLVLHGTTEALPVSLVDVIEGANYVAPVRRHRSWRAAQRTYDLTLLGQGTYKLQVPGYRPFGLVNVGR